MLRTFTTTTYAKGISKERFMMLKKDYLGETQIFVEFDPISSISKFQAVYNAAGRIQYIRHLVDIERVNNDFQGNYIILTFDKYSV